MPRNLDHRVEVLFPLRDHKLISRIHDDVLAQYLADTVKARRMLPDGTYIRKKKVDGKPAANSQEALIAKRRSVENYTKPLRLKPRAS